MITRQHPINNKTVILIGYTGAIKYPNNDEHIEPLMIQGTIEDILFEMNRFSFFILLLLKTIQNEQQ